MSLALKKCIGSMEEKAHQTGDDIRTPTLSDGTRGFKLDIADMPQFSQVRKLRLLRHLRTHGS